MSRESSPSSPGPTSNSAQAETSSQSSAQCSLLPVSPLVAGTSSTDSTPPSSSDRNPTSNKPIQPSSSGSGSSTGGSQSAFVIPPLAKLTRYSSESSEASSSPDVDSNKCTPLFNCKCDFRAIGCGKYGQVFEVNNKGSVYAAKEYYNVSPEKLNTIFSKLSNLRHDNLVTYHGVYKKIDPDNSERAVVFMDLIHLSLPAVIEDASRDLDTRTTLSILCDIAHGLIFLHKQGIFHCDLIPNNVLLTAELRAKVSDYGNARVDLVTTHHGRYTCDYLPPEAIEGNSPDVKVDVFSFGHLLMYIVLRYQPHPLEQAVYKENGQHMARSELARRERFVTKLTVKIENGELQPLLQWTKSCLDNDACNRPVLTDFFSVTKTCKF